MQIWACPNSCGATAQSVGVHGSPEHSCSSADGDMVAYTLVEGELLPIAEPTTAANVGPSTLDDSAPEA